jgi:gamma-glutamylcyclotransferase (GGCT)/AIG2-like uncharacterized protein YtfP
MKSLLFTYGTLRTTSKIEEALVLRANAKHIAHGTLHGRLFDLGEYPGIIYSPRKLDLVVGDVFELTNPEKVLAYLDAYEGDEYDRRQYWITLDDGSRVRAWVYVYLGPTEGKQRIASGDYLLAR